jgi:hypothetical protein
MLSDPGGVVARYLQGRRRTYLGPVTYFFFGAALMLLVYPLYENDMAQTLNTRTTTFATGDHPFLSPEQAAAYSQLMLELARQTAAATLTICVPFALLVRLLFRSTQVNVVETLVFTLFVFGQAMMIHSLLVPLAWLLDSTPGAYTATLVLPMLFVGGHAAAGFFGRGRAALHRAGAVLRVSLAFGVSYLVWSLLVTAALLGYVLYAY